MYTISRYDNRDQMYLHTYSLEHKRDNSKNIFLMGNDAKHTHTEI